jgi:hypothetical protein
MRNVQTHPTTDRLAELSRIISALWAVMGSLKGYGGFTRW